MGIFDRFRPTDESRGRTYEGQQTRLSEDEQALARYRYMVPRCLFTRRSSS